MPPSASSTAVCGDVSKTTNESLPDKRFGPLGLSAREVCVTLKINLARYNSSAHARCRVSKAGGDQGGAAPRMQPAAGGVPGGLRSCEAGTIGEWELSDGVQTLMAIRRDCQHRLWHRVCLSPCSDDYSSRTHSGSAGPLAPARSRATRTGLRGAVCGRFSGSNGVRLLDRVGAYF